MTYLQDKILASIKVKYPEAKIAHVEACDGDLFIVFYLDMPISDRRLEGAIFICPKQALEYNFEKITKK